MATVEAFEYITIDFVLGDPPACDQDDRSHQKSYKGKKRDANHECRVLQFFNLFRVGLKADHLLPPVA